jgi:hypothetical protein
VSGGYDNRIVRGPSDLLIDANFVGNDVPIPALMVAGVTSVFNLFNSNSFYLNGFNVFLETGLMGTSGTFGIYVGPNAGSIVGASRILAAGLGLSATPVAQFTQVFNVANLNYRNRTGANQYVHMTYGGTITGGSIGLFLIGGMTALLS